MTTMFAEDIAPSKNIPRDGHTTGRPGKCLKRESLNVESVNVREIVTSGTTPLNGSPPASSVAHVMGATAIAEIAVTAAIVIATAMIAARVIMTAPAPSPKPDTIGPPASPLTWLTCDKNGGLPRFVLMQNQRCCITRPTHKSF